MYTPTIHFLVSVSKYLNSVSAMVLMQCNLVVLKNVGIR